MSVHIYRAKGQPATRHWIDLSTIVGGKVKRRGFWSKHKPRELLPAMCCRRKRIAANLVAHVYYDGTWFYCRDGKGCR